MNDEEGDVWDDESAYLEMLANEGARLRNKQNRVDGDGMEGAEVSGDDDDSDDDEEEIEEELGYLSPIDGVDPYVTFKRALTGKLRVSCYIFLDPSLTPCSSSDAKPRGVWRCYDFTRHRSADTSHGGDEDCRNECCHHSFRLDAVVCFPLLLASIRCIATLESRFQLLIDIHQV